MTVNDDDDLLDLLGAEARAERDREPDAVWDELAHGKVDPDDPALRDAAADDQEHRGLVAAFTPLSPERQEAIAAEVRGKPRKGPRSDPSRIVPLVVVGTAALALAAVAVLIVLPRNAEPLTSYDITIVGGVQELRGDTEDAQDVPRFRSSSRVEIRLRPETRVSGDVEARGFVESEAGAIEPWPLSPEHSSGGAMRVVGTASQLFDLPAGTFTLIVVVATPDVLPPSTMDPSGQLEELADEPDARVLRTSIVLEEPTR